MPDLPDLLTVEEAARLIRVGRTKAYAMAREWRATEGRSGLPVVDFGHVLRVPRYQLEVLLGGPLSSDSPVTSPPSGVPAAAAPGPEPAVEAQPPAASSSPSPRTPVPSRRRKSRDQQPTLPFAS